MSRACEKRNDCFKLVRSSPAYSFVFSVNGQKVFPVFTRRRARERTEKEREGRAEKMTKIHGWSRSSSGRCAIFSSRFVHWEKSLMGHHEQRICCLVFIVSKNSSNEQSAPCCKLGDPLEKGSKKILTSAWVGYSRAGLVNLNEVVALQELVYNKIYGFADLELWTVPSLRPSSFLSSHRPLKFAVVSRAVCSTNKGCVYFQEFWNSIFKRVQRDNFYWFFFYSTIFLWQLNRIGISLIKKQQV